MIEWEMSVLFAGKDTDVACACSGESRGRP